LVAVVEVEFQQMCHILLKGQVERAEGESGSKQKKSNGEEAALSPAMELPVQTVEQWHQGVAAAGPADFLRWFIKPRPDHLQYKPTPELEARLEVVTMGAPARQA
jgi:hypothetical protein